MKIQSLLERAGGTKVPMDTTEYHFKPTDEDVRHIAEVTIEKHARRFLSIKEAYVSADNTVLAPLASTVLLGSDAFPAQIEIGTDLVSLGNLVAAAHDATGLSVEDWNALSDAERTSEIQDEIDVRKGTALESGDANTETDEDTPEAELLGSKWEPATVKIGEDDVATAFIANLAFVASGLSVEDWNAQSIEDAGAKMQVETEKLIEAAKVKEVKPATIIANTGTGSEIPLLDRKPQVIEDSMSPQVKRKITMANKQLKKDQDAAIEAAKK